MGSLCILSYFCNYSSSPLLLQWLHSSRVILDCLNPLFLTDKTVQWRPIRFLLCSSPEQLADWCRKCRSTMSNWGKSLGQQNLCRNPPYSYPYSWKTTSPYILITKMWQKPLYWLLLLDETKMWTMKESWPSQGTSYYGAKVAWAIPYLIKFNVWILLKYDSIQYMSHSQMLGKFEYTLPAKFWRLVGCTEMLSW